MEQSKSPGAKWLLGTLLVSAFVIFSILVGQVGKGRRLQGDVDRELAGLASVGVELRRSTTYEEANRKLSDISSMMDRKADPGEILARIKQLAEGPPIEIREDARGYGQDELRQFANSGDSVREWLNARGIAAAKVGDRAGFDRIYACAEAFVPFSQPGVMGYGMLSKRLPLEGPVATEPSIHPWLKEKWIAGEFPHLSRERLTSMGQMITHPNVYANGPGGTNPLANMADRFGKPSEMEGRLIALKQLRMLAESVTKQTTKAALSRDLPDELQKALLALPGGYLISNRLYLPADFSMRDVHVALVKMDLAERHAAKKSLRPTWSTAYCNDPLTGGTFTVLVSGNIVKLRGTNWSIDTAF